MDNNELGHCIYGMSKEEMDAYLAIELIMLRLSLLLYEILLFLMIPLSFVMIPFPGKIYMLPCKFLLAYNDTIHDRAIIAEEIKDIINSDTCDNIPKEA